MASPRPRPCDRRSGGRRAEKLLGEAAGQPAALVFDFDANPALGGNGPEADMAFAAAVLERVAEEIGDGGRQEQPVGVDGNRARHRRDVR